VRAVTDDEHLCGASKLPGVVSFGFFEMSQYHLAMGDGKKFAEKTVKLGCRGEGAMTSAHQFIVQDCLSACLVFEPRDATMPGGTDLIVYEHSMAASPTETTGRGRQLRVAVGT
jgi:hypothetical protein